MKKLTLSLMFVVLTVTFAFAQATVTVTIDASSKTEWVYFSFSKGDTVTVADPQTSLEWDLKLKRYRFGTNSGTSGSGLGGAINMGKVNFDSVIEAPESEYTVDDSVTFETMGGPKTYSLNPVLSGWAKMEGMPPVFIPGDSIYVIKTAEGKYAKAWFQSYYHPTEGSSGHITLQYYYELSGPSGVIAGSKIVPTDYVLEQNYPNPFNAATIIRYSLSEPARVKLTVYDLLGNQVDKLVNREQGAGSYNLQWTGFTDGETPLSSGTYICRLNANGSTKNIVEMIKMMYLK